MSHATHERLTVSESQKQDLSMPNNPRNKRYAGPLIRIVDEADIQRGALGGACLRRTARTRLIASPPTLDSALGLTIP